MNAASTEFTGNQSKLGRLSLELFRTNVINEAEASINSYYVITEVPVRKNIDVSPLISTSSLGFPIFGLSFDFCANINITIN